MGDKRAHLALNSYELRKGIDWPSILAASWWRLPNCGIIASAKLTRAADTRLVFRETLDLEGSDAPWLRDVLLEAARSGQASHSVTDAWGSHWRLDATIRRHGKSAVVRTIWIVRSGEDVPRFVTCWVL